MSETPKPYESFITRTTPEVPVRLEFNGHSEAALLRYDNTLVVTHNPEFEQFDHIMVYGLTDKPIYIWRPGDDEWDLYEILMHHGFDNYDKVYPSLEDEIYFFNTQKEKMLGELDDIV